MWPIYLLLAIFAYNTFNTPNLANYSPYGIVFRRKPKLLLNLDTTLYKMKAYSLIVIIFMCAFANTLLLKSCQN